MASAAGIHPNSLANLRPLANDGSGVPNAGKKPERLTFRSALADKLYERGLAERTRLEDLADTLIRFALAGNVPAIKELLDRFEGPVVQRIEVDDQRLVRAAAKTIAEMFTDEQVQIEFVTRLTANLSQV